LPTQAFFEPFFCAWLVKQQQPMFGPYIALPLPAQQLALQLLHFLSPLSPKLLSALARCAQKAPELAPSLAKAIKAAGGEMPQLDMVVAAGKC
tara:strand:- start:413 stop:691 length:279 start_codon:yes stop_codon:yes gene_type:complete